MIDFKIDKIDKEKGIVTYNVYKGKYIIELEHGTKIISFKSEIDKYSPDLEWDFYSLFNTNSTQQYINSTDMEFIIRCLLYIVENRWKIINGIV